MAVGKYLSLEEARKGKELKRFADEHQSVGDKRKFEDLMKAMATTQPPKPKRGRDE
jgi:hypothetical protein